MVAAHDSAQPEGADYFCDGLDDQVEINAAIIAFQGATGMIKLLDGTFCISSPILVNDNLTLNGEDNDTVILLVEGSNCNVIEDLSHIRRANVCIQNLRIDGNRENQSEGMTWGDGHAILRAGHNAIYENLYIENCFTGGIRHDEGDNTKIIDNTIVNCPWKALCLTESFNGEILRNKIYDGGTDPNENVVISCWLGGNHRIEDNIVDGGGYNTQIMLWDAPSCKVNYNTVLNGLNMGIVSRGEGSECIGNTVMHCGENAIDAGGADHVWIEDNFISWVGKPDSLSHEHSGICMNTDYSTATNNTIEYCGKSGIFTGSHVGNQIIGNMISNCGQDGSFNSGITIQIWDPEDVINQGTVIRNNICYDDQGVPTQKYGLLLLPGKGYIDDLVVEDNDFSGVSSIGIKIWGEDRVRNPTIRNNLGVE